jgi:uncharacterized membrane protein
MRIRAERHRTPQDRLADRITAFSGSMAFLWLHGGWFLVWIALNLGWVRGVPKFDPFPFGLLTMVVSLEAIFLSTIVLISQNRESELNSRKESLDLQIDLLAEYEITHNIRLIRRIAEKLGVEDEDAELEQLCEDVAPSLVMREIERLER